MLALALSPALILQLTDNLKLGVLGSIWYNYSNGSLAQLARAPHLHRGGQEFEPLATHQKIKKEPRALYLFSDCCKEVRTPKEFERGRSRIKIPNFIWDFLRRRPAGMFFA